MAFYRVVFFLMAFDKKGFFHSLIIYGFVFISTSDLQVMFTSLMSVYDIFIL